MWRIVQLLLLSPIAFGGRSRDLASDAKLYLLPGNIRPEHYDLTIHANIENFNVTNWDTMRFQGIVEITALTLRDVKEIVLHSWEDIRIYSVAVVSLETDGPSSFSVDIGSYNEDTEKQIFNVTPSLPSNGRFKIIIHYSGENNARPIGFYLSNWYDWDVNHYVDLLTTQFENFAARRAFPCFDEPKYKATFQLTMLYNQSLADIGYRAYFNTRIESEQISNGVHVTKFEKTPYPLSTYLVAFLLTPFVTSPELAYFNSSFNGEPSIKPFMTMGQPIYFSPRRQDLISQIAGPAALEIMTRLTGIGYAFDKVEQAGIPDFAEGAMENWGLVTYREEAIFYDNESDTTWQKEYVAKVVTHELSHQWFGNLVTLHWWSDLWINEGFAHFFEFHATDQIREPDLDTSDWDLIGEFITDSRYRNAFPTDQFISARALTFEAYDRTTINDFADYISYDKGGSVIRMWMHALGTDIFYSGLNRYLLQQQMGMGTPEILLASWDGTIDDLPDELKPQIPLPIAELFKGWHTQPGYPVININRNNSTLTITQERFLMDTTDTETKWNIPITYSTDLEYNFNNTLPVAYLTDDVKHIKVSIKDAAADWVVVNNQATGYYRVNYTADNWSKLDKVVNDPDSFQQIHEYNRAQILEDSRAISSHDSLQQGLSFSVFFKLLHMIKHDRSLVVWKTAIRITTNILQNLESAAVYRDTYFLFKDFIVELIKPAFIELGMHVYEDDSHTKKILRSEVAEFACLVGLPLCKQQARQLFQSGYTNTHPDLRKTVLCEGIMQGESAEWEKLRLESGKTTLSHRKDLLRALTCSRDAGLITRLLDELSQIVFNEYDTAMILADIFTNHPEFSLDIMKIINSHRWNNKINNDLENLKIAACTRLIGDNANAYKGLCSSVQDKLNFNVKLTSNTHKAIKELLLNSK